MSLEREIGQHVHFSFRTVRFAVMLYCSRAIRECGMYVGRV